MLFACNVKWWSGYMHLLALQICHSVECVCRYILYTIYNCRPSDSKLCCTYPFSFLSIFFTLTLMLLWVARCVKYKCINIPIITSFYFRSQTFTQEIKKHVGMACQKVCKQGRDDACKQRSTYWQSPIPTSFSHYC